MQETRILVVDDDTAMLTLCRAVLSRRNWEVECASDSRTAVKAIDRHRFDLVVLDRNLPDGDGLDIGRRLHEKNIPFLLMTAYSQPRERLVGFEIGAADYLTKPFYPDELVHRICRVLGRENRGAPPRHPGYEIGSWWFSPTDCFLLHRQNNRRIDLTWGECRLLATLAGGGGRVINREQLLYAVARGEGPGHHRSVDVLVSRLRKKMAATSGRADDPITTVSGAGYRLATGQILEFTETEQGEPADDHDR